MIRRDGSYGLTDLKGDSMKKNLYPELMSERELAESFRELEIQMQWEVLTWLREPKKRVKILEELMEGTRNQYRCAILITLRENADRISPDRRRFLLPYLLDLLVDNNGAVRGKALDCAGCMIALECEEDIGVFQESLRRLLFVSGSRAEATSGKFTTGTLRALVRTVYNNVSEDRKKAVLSAFSNYFKSTKWGQKSCVCLLRAAYGLPYTVWGAMQRGNILGFVRHFLKNDEGEVRLAALLLLDRWLQDGWKPSPDFAQYLKGVLRDIVRSKDSAAAGSSNDRSANGRIDTGLKGMSALVWISRRVLDQLFPAAAREGALAGSIAEQAEVPREPRLQRSRPGQTHQYAYIEGEIQRKGSGPRVPRIRVASPGLHAPEYRAGALLPGGKRPA